MQSENDTTFAGEIKVASRIIDYLSSGLYHTPAACLKELVNNSYDARATRVDIFVKPDADRIIIEDNGDGMSKEEFVKHFDRVSESHKRDGSDVTKGVPPKGGRPKIGKIGIGFIAANELCESLEIFSTKKGSKELLHIIIDFREMRKPIQQRRRNGDDIVKADYQGSILEAKKEDHYTQLFLTEVRGAAKHILAGADSQTDTEGVLSLYGLKSESIYKMLLNSDLRSWKEFDTYSETMLNIGLNVPVKYYENWLADKLRKEVTDLDSNITELGFNVFYDGAELRKPIVFNFPEQSALIDRFEFEGKHVSAKGYFYAQHGTIKPRELQGLLVRIRQAAVGEYDHQFWGLSATESSLIQRWISAEIWADNRLEEAMNIDRRTLRIAHPAYVELRDAIHDHLRLVLKRTRKELYKVGSAERKQEKTDALIESVSDVANEIVAPLSEKAAMKINKMVIKSAIDKASLRNLERKYSVAEFLEMVSEVAKEVLSPADSAKFLERLTERLGNE